MRSWSCATLVVLAGCRLRFDELPDSGGVTSDASGDSALVVPPPSCMPANATCGPAADQDCCASPAIPGSAGTPFFRTYDMASDGMWTNMAQPATVSAFRLDRYEVTVARFRHFVASGMGTQLSPPAIGAGSRFLNDLPSQGGWRSDYTAGLPADTNALTTLVQCGGIFGAWTALPGVNEDRPIGCITYYVAMAFCIWDGGYLPTQTEYFYAAVGGTEQRAYPWSQPASDLTIDCAHANSQGCAGRGQKVGATSPLGDGRWGHADLAGNAWEWVLDRTVGLSFLPLPCNDCAVFQPDEPNPPVDGSGRSGSYQNTIDTVRSNSAIPYPLDSVFDSFGIRCARPI